MDAVEAVSAALEASCAEDGDRLVVDLDSFERALKRARVPFRKANKAQLNSELQITREEIRVQKARLRSAEHPEPIEKRIEELGRREQELSETIWPKEEEPQWASTQASSASA